MALSETVKTRILVLSDTHTALPFPSDIEHDLISFKWPLPKADILLHAGDLTMNGKDIQHERAVELIKGVDPELKIVIPGNHDITLDYDYYQKYQHHTLWRKYSDEKLKEIEELYTGQAAKDAGLVYIVEGTRTFTLKNGAKFTIYANAYQPTFCNWAFGYPRKIDRFNKDSEHAINPIPTDTPIDIMLTHGPPFGVLDETTRDESVGCEHLRRAVNGAKPRLHCFGHIHEDWGAVKKDWTVEDEEKSQTRMSAPAPQKLAKEMGAYYDATGLEIGKETLFVNASVMNVSYDPLQAPWIVDLMLPKGSKEAS